MTRAASRSTLLLILIAPGLNAQMSDRCSPGWSLLNRLREQLTPDTPAETLELVQVSLKRHLASCREIPDLWYYRALVDEKLKDLKDAAYARKEAAAGNSDALREGVNPFAGVKQTVSVLPAKLGHKYALVVGVNEFQHARGLNFAVNDATSFADLLVDPQVGRFQKTNVRRLLNSEATLAAFRTNFGEIRAVAKEEDLVLIYIASHGSPRDSDPNGVSYVILNDTKTDTAANLYATSLQMIDLVEIMQRDLKSKRVVLILDTCFSGGATGVRSMQIHSRAAGPESDFSAAADRIEDRTAKGVARAILSASRAGEVSQEDEDTHHGFFTYFLLETLKKDHGMAPLNDVFQSVHNLTAAAAGRTGLSQTPTMRNTPDGLQIVLGAPGGE